MTWMKSTRCASARIHCVVKPNMGSSASVARLNRRSRMFHLLGRRLRDLENPSVSFDIGFGTEQTLGKFSGTLPHLMGLVGIFEHPAKFLGKRWFIAGRQQKPRITLFHHFRNASHMTCNNGRAGG